MDRNLGLELVRVTEAAALAAHEWEGRGDSHQADEAAVRQMRARLNDLPDLRATVVIGEGERDAAPMLYRGEKVGGGWGYSFPPGYPVLNVQLAVDPLEGTGLCAYGRPDAIAVVAAAVEGEGSLLQAPDVYMMKIAVGPEARGVIDIHAPIEHNLQCVARAKGVRVEDLTVIMLDRDRHKEYMERVRKAGAKVHLITDGDVAAAIATAKPEAAADILYGSGGAPEGVLAAAALRCLGGEIQGILQFRNDDERARAYDSGIRDHDKVYTTEELASGNVLFVATGVTGYPGRFLDGVLRTTHGAQTHSVIMRSRTGTIRWMRTEHVFRERPSYEA
ncbi:MAG TPA: class II fructose-bisphosphatase [Dehalococcoidia bacterium]